MIKACLSILLLLSFQNSSVDRFKSEMSAVKKSLDNASYYEVETEFKIFNNQTGQLFENTTGLYIKNGKSYYNRVDVMETIHTPKYNIVIDNVSKYIAIDTVTLFSSTMNSVVMSMADTMDFDNVVNVKALPLQGDSKSFEVQFRKDNAMADKFQFYYNQKTLLPIKTVIYLREKMQGKKSDEFISPRFEMEFRNYRMSGAKKHLTELGNYVSRSANGKWVIVNERYKQYKLKKTF